MNIYVGFMRILRYSLTDGRLLNRYEYMDLDLYSKFFEPQILLFFGL